ncbi:MAG: cytosine deaminase, partial [Halothece sp.]
MILQLDHYWLKNAHIPAFLIENCSFQPETREGLCLVDIEIENGKIAQIVPARNEEIGYIPTVNLRRGIVFPCFAD